MGMGCLKVHQVVLLGLLLGVLLVMGLQVELQGVLCHHLPMVDLQELLPQVKQEDHQVHQRLLVQQV